MTVDYSGIMVDLSKSARKIGRWIMKRKNISDSHSVENGVQRI